MKKIKIVFSVSILVLGLVSLTGYMDNKSLWIIDIFSHFTVQYAFLALLLSFFCFRKRFYPLMYLAVLLSLFNFGTFMNLGSSVDASVDSKNAFTVYSANIYKYNDNLSELISDIREKKAAIVLLLEVTPEHAEQLKPVIETYPFHIEKSPIGTDGLGMIFLSDFPVQSYKITELSEYGNALLEAEITINNKQVLFYGAHFPRPGLLPGKSERAVVFMNLAQQIKDMPTPSIIAGDFNATPFSPIFKKFVNISGLRNSMDGFGWQPTWPVFFPPLWIPIDHILVSPEIHVLNRTTGSYIGSDHYPILADLSID